MCLSFSHTEGWWAQQVSTPLNGGGGRKVLTCLEGRGGGSFGPGILGKKRNLEILPKQGIWFAQVLNSLNLKVKNISKFAA